MNGASLKAFSTHPLLAGAAVAAWVCLDPLLSFWLDIHYFPYFLTAVLAALLLGGIVVWYGSGWIHRRKDSSMLVFAIVAAQFSGVGIGSIDILDVATALLAAVWLMIVVVESSRPIQTSPLMWCLTGMMALAFLALVNHPPLGGLVAIAEKFVLFFVVVDLFRRVSQIDIALRSLIWTGFFSSLVAIGQAVVFWIWGILWTTGIGESQAAGYLKPTPFGIMPRATAFFPNPAGLNDYLLFTVSVVLFTIANTRSTGLRSVYWLILICQCAAIVLTWSASSFSALAMVLLLFVYMNRPQYFFHYTAAIGALGLAAYWSGLLEFAYLFMKNYASASGEVRTQLLELAMAMLSRSPVIGMGVQNFASASGNLFQEGIFTVSYPVHNAFVQMATELGLFGALLYVSLVVFIVARLIKSIRYSPREWRWVFKSQLLGMLPLIVHMFSEPMAYEGTLWLFFGIIEGSVMVMRRQLAAAST